MAYETVIGLEIHVQMNTNTKLFCRCSNDSFNVQPNTNVCPICMGYPGQLPITNETAVQKGILTGLALNCEIAHFSKFDRKQYFYPDLPSGFQISQYDQPLCGTGSIDIHRNDNSIKKIGLTRIHLENDAGKLTHTAHGTLCDYNRAGTPLMEIVSDPDMNSIEEASLYAREVQKIVRHIGTSDADMEKGHMRFDVNISLRPEGQAELGTKVEIKNLNSFTALEKAIEFEMKRQAEMLDNNETIDQETRGWDDTKMQTISQRSKEQAHDYRYFPEPDLPPITLTKEEIDTYRTQIPELPRAKYERYISNFNLPEEDARILTEEPARAAFFETVLTICNNPKLAVSFINTILAKPLSDAGLSFNQSPITAENMGKLINLVETTTVSNNQAKTEIFEAMYQTGKDPETIVKEKGIKQVTDTGAITELCKEAILECPDAVTDFKAGKDKAIGAIVGKVMQKSRGQANPGMVDKTLRELLK
ncbi:Asp-tRNA(Asn)/Glu-tRNA(Gln) amidotransferase GatCAB subunit B [Candidatus Peregrinibacteria bacterium CG11_big_fil_rev_8_21_14_0_20_41_10]|nr:MAG: Asp-tRNA(Asn)/Glu-tRNA(Gln) amidotransferase GatCAB subunit B [Candidatus Peregrinibacteria bacterium CG11_big_fil_rev_8_21_14_0_20_41_10]PIZ73341.1 MAG: Asp-tRNA(Asn)/Glu-tRNA(Gln) amidotransferase GatCAB subunit B [Candidatus Peregrinibacteria bacterium CG_4_10_14_0_2_um_filter_41_8]